MLVAHKGRRYILQQAVSCSALHEDLLIAALIPGEAVMRLCATDRSGTREIVGVSSWRFAMASQHSVRDYAAGQPECSEDTTLSDTNDNCRPSEIPLLVPFRELVPSDCARIFVKLEWENPTGSMKDRAALAMVARTPFLIAPADSVRGVMEGSRVARSRR